MENKNKAKYVLDIGMNNGDDTEYYLAKGFNVIAVEANPYLCENANQRFKFAIKNGQLIIVNAAISENTLLQKFHVNLTNDHWSSLDLKWATRENSKVKTLKIPGICIGEYLKQKNIAPYFVKIDIEGGDMLALNQILESGLLPQYLSIEDCHLGFQYIEKLVDYGYKNFKLINQAEVQLRPDKQIDFHFKLGSSGPFGDEAPGDWKSEEDFIDHYSKVARNRLTLARIAQPNIWWDIHCSL